MCRGRNSAGVCTIHAKKQISGLLKRLPIFFWSILYILNRNTFNIRWHIFRCHSRNSKRTKKQTRISLRNSKFSSQQLHQSFTTKSEMSVWVFSISIVFQSVSMPFFYPHFVFLWHKRNTIHFFKHTHKRLVSSYLHFIYVSI